VRVSITYQQALVECPDQVEKVINKLRKGRSKHRQAEPDQLEWFLEVRQPGQTLAEALFGDHLSAAQLAAARLQDAEVDLLARKGRWRRAEPLDDVTQFVHSSLSDHIEQERGTNELKEVRDKALALGYDLVPLPEPPRFQEVQRDELLQMDPDGLESSVNDAVNVGDMAEADRISNILVQFLQAGGRRPLVLQDPLMMHSFRRVCLAREIGDPLRGRCLGCDGGGCRSCGGSGYVN